MDTTAANLWHKEITKLAWQERNHFLLNNKFMSDCAFIVQTVNDDVIKIPAHKYILGAQSWEFYNLFFLMEAGSNEIPINDFPVEVVKIFLELIYKESADLTMDVIWDVLKPIKSFSVDGLKDFCGEFLAKNITSENVLELLDKAADFELENFNARCMMHMSRNDKEYEYFETESFLQIKNKTLVNIIKSDDLRGNELDLYKSAYNWATKSCEKNDQVVSSENLRSALGDAFKYIRFGAMTGNEFSECFNENSILNPQETVQILQFICDGKTDCEFSGKKRTGFGIKQLKLNEPVSTCAGNEFYINFTTDKPIYLLGVLMFGHNNVAKYVEENFSIVLEASKTNLMSKWFRKSRYGSKETYEQQFDKQIYLESNTEYTIRFYGLQTQLQYYYDDIETDYVFDGVFFKFNAPIKTPFAGLIFE